MPSRFSRSVETRRRYDWLRMMFPGARLFRAPIWCNSGGMAARERQGALSQRVWWCSSTGWIRTRFVEGGGQLDRRRARRVLNPCARESKARIGRFLRKKLMSDHVFFSLRGPTRSGERARFVGFFRVHMALDGWMLARAPASPAQGLHHHGPRYFNFPHFCMMCLRNLELLIKTGWSVICPLCCWERWSWVGDNTIRIDRSCSRYGVEPLNFLSRFGSLLVWVAGYHHDMTRWPS